MKGLRPLIVGIVLASLWIIAYTTWQLTRTRGGGPVDPFPVGPAQEAQPQDNHVWHITDDPELPTRSLPSNAGRWWSGSWLPATSRTDACGK